MAFDRARIGGQAGVGTRVETSKRLAQELGAGKLKAEVVDLRVADQLYVKQIT